MNKKIIWKFPLAKDFIVGSGTCASLWLPDGGKIVHTEILEDTRVVIWVEFEVPNDWDGKEPTTTANYIQRIGTGAMIPERFVHFHTFVTEGSFVWHLYRFEDRPDANG